MAKVILDHVTKKFPNGIVAVNDATLEIKDREFVVLVGPSGCGKSTTLRMVAGLEEITQGNVYIGETLVNDVPPKDRDIAMVFQSYALYPHMDVYNNMAFGLKLRKFPKADIERRVKEAARILEIEHLLDRKPKALSGGQRQRVALGRAIVRDPKVFLMDEPLSNLDAKLRVQMRAEISKLHNRLQVTIIYVTHDQIEAMTMGDRIVVLNDGIIQQVGSPLDVYDNPINLFVATFIGTLPMNTMNAVLKQDGSRIYADLGSFKLYIPDGKFKSIGKYIGQEVIVGIRPENIVDRASYTDAKEEDIITGMVDVVELIGSEVNLFMSNGNQNFTARVEAHTKAADGTQHQVVFNTRKLHLFDKKTDNAIL